MQADCVVVLLISLLMVLQTQDSLDATFATVVGVFAFLSSIVIGIICEVSTNHAASPHNVKIVLYHLFQVSQACWTCLIFKDAPDNYDYIMSVPRLWNNLPTSLLHQSMTSCMGLV
jgi:hypothetical protein